MDNWSPGHQHMTFKGVEFFQFEFYNKAPSHSVFIISLSVCVCVFFFVYLFSGLGPWSFFKE